MYESGFTSQYTRMTADNYAVQPEVELRANRPWRPPSLLGQKGRKSA